MVQQVLTGPEYDELIAAHPVVLVDFFATWCGPCKAVAPILEKMEQEYEAAEKQVKFLKVDVDQLRELSVKLSIAAMPTFLIYHNGILEKTIVGANVPEIQTVLAELTAAAGPAPVEEPVAA